MNSTQKLEVKTVILDALKVYNDNYFKESPDYNLEKLVNETTDKIAAIAERNDNEQ